MSGNSFKCGIHRFDGHGNNSYRPRDSTCDQISLQFASLKAERDKQDSTWGSQQQPFNNSLKKPETSERNLPVVLPESPSIPYESRPPWLVQQVPLSAKVKHRYN
jgi:hypothetical protein